MPVRKAAYGGNAVRLQRHTIAVAFQGQRVIGGIDAAGIAFEPNFFSALGGLYAGGACARSRAHTVSEMQEKIAEIISQGGYI